MNCSKMVSSNGSNMKNDRELQEKLYTNIALLNMMYEPSPDFKAVFKKDMFAKINKTAFLHVVHYLLTILNPEMAKEKLLTWPTCNVINRENKFRNEVLQYLNEINKKYEEADLPVMMSSHLLAPGGYRFNHFMYKLSQLVLLEDLKREFSADLLCRPKPGRNEELNEKAYQNIMKCTEDINEETNKALEKFNRTMEMFQEEADKTVKEKNEVHKELKEINEKIEIEEGRLRELNLSDEDVTKRLEEMQKKFKTIEKICSIYTECKKLINHLKENGKEGEPLDLAESMKVKNIKIKRQLSELPDYEVEELESYLQMVNERKGELEQLEKNVRIKHEAFIKAMNASEDVLKNVIEDLRDT